VVVDRHVQARLAVVAGHEPPPAMGDAAGHRQSKQQQ
jgi:hypothetical protein